MESTDWSDCNLKQQNVPNISDQTFRPTHITFPHQKFILWDGHGNQNAVTSQLVAVQYEGATRANPENWKMKVKQFSTLYVELIGATYLYTLPLAVQQYWSKIANATPLLLLDNVEHLLMTYSCSTSSQTLHTSLTISAVSALRKCLARSDLGSWHACDLISILPT